jgi:Large polyvalent protein associated domain 29
MSYQYISVTETAKLIRQVLKESFPDTKFSVRSDSYSGGASIRIRYQNGPTYDQVKSVISVFEGAYFDGMQDYKGMNYGSLDGKEVRFGADFIFITREYSVAFLEGVATKVANDYGVTEKMNVVDNGFGAYVQNAGSIKLPNMGDYLDRMISREVAKISLADTMPSKTFDRVGFLGDDGYGYGCVGRLNNMAEA